MSFIENAERVGGSCTYRFSQGQALKIAQATQRYSASHQDGSWNDQGKMYKMVLRGREGHQREMGGVCATIAAFWVAFHSAQDTGANASFTKGRSVWDYLFDGNGLNLGAATNITVEHHKSSGNQLTYFEDFLKKFKLKKRTKTMSGGNVPNVWMPFSANSAFSVADAITSQNGYKLIQLKKTLDGSGGGHMVAAWSDMQDVLFMDPNFGEFWFPNKTAFKIWLSDFWSSTYGNPRLANNKRYKSARFHVYVAGR